MLIESTSHFSQLISKVNRMLPTLLQPYLTFNGQCDEAIAFYQKALGAEVVIRMQFNESPDPTPEGILPPGFEEKVMHCTLKIGEAILMCSDGCEPTKTGFAGFSLSLALPTEEDAHRLFANLSEGGQVTMPLGKTFWSPCFGMLADRFGVSWMISVNHPVTV